MKLIIAGPRDFTDYSVLLAAIDSAPRDWFMPDEVVSGHQEGVDALGEQWAREHGIPIRAFPADWDRFGKAAGPMRNREMAQYADALLALFAFGHGSETPGTRDMIRQARAHGLRVHVFDIGAWR